MRLTLAKDEEEKSSWVGAELRTSGAKGVAERQRRDEDVVELADNRAEVWYEVKPGRRDRQQRDQHDFAPPWDMFIANQAVQQHEAIRDESGQCASLCPTPATTSIAINARYARATRML